MAHSVGIELTIDDFQAVSDRVPFIADLKPSGKYVFEDVYKIGGIPSTFSFVLFLLDATGVQISGLCHKWPERFEISTPTAALCARRKRAAGSDEALHPK